MADDLSERARQLGALIGPFPAEVEGRYLGWLEGAAGQLWGQPGLSAPLRSAATLGVDTALGVQVELRLHVLQALRNGLSRDEVASLLHHCAIYAGVPRANAALRIAKAAFDEIAADPRAATGAREPERGPVAELDGYRTDPEGRARAIGAVIGPLPAEVEQRHLRWLVAVGGPVWADAHASQPLRSAVTLGVLTALSEPVELAAHVRRAVVQSLLTRAEVGELLHHCGGYAGVPRANAALRTARAVFHELDAG
jgi:alkylhydroperoxidase/carboxymuconolactone decarboxylase family protein YurZ